MQSTAIETNTPDTLFFAQPYDMDAKGFYFSSYEEYETKSENNLNSFGDPVEEYEIQLIEGSDLLVEVLKSNPINQANIEDTLDFIEEWEDKETYEKIQLLAMLEAGYSLDSASIHYEDVSINYADSYKSLAEQFVEDGLFGEIPENLIFYLDYEAMGRDLSCDYTEGEFLGETVFYRCD